jgi:hypothetical protein
LSRGIKARWLVRLVIEHRTDYEDPLDLADAAWNEERVNVSAMERLIESVLAKQLARVYDMAAGVGAA